MSLSRVEFNSSISSDLNDLCAQANCGLLLDVTNLFINSKNHRFDPLRWLHELEPGPIQQLHIVGYSRQGDRYTDDHSQSVQDELLELAGAVWPTRRFRPSSSNATHNFRRQR